MRSQEAKRVSAANLDIALISAAQDAALVSTNERAH